MRNQFTQAIGELRGKLIDTSRRKKLINYLKLLVTKRNILLKEEFNKLCSERETYTEKATR